MNERGGDNENWEWKSGIQGLTKVGRGREIDEDY